MIDSKPVKTWPNEIVHYATIYNRLNCCKQAETRVQINLYWTVPIECDSKQNQMMFKTFLVLNINWCYYGSIVFNAYSLFVLADKSLTCECVRVFVCSCVIITINGWIWAKHERARLAVNACNQSNRYHFSGPISMLCSIDLILNCYQFNTQVCTRSTHRNKKKSYNIFIIH